MKTTFLFASALVAQFAVSALAAPPAEIPDYAVDAAYGQERLPAPPLNITADEKDVIHVLLSNGAVSILGPSGEPTGGFNPELPAPATAIAINAGKIYLLYSTSKEEEVVVRDRKTRRNTPTGVRCGVFGPTGTKEREIGLPGILTAKDAHFVKGQLAVADYQTRQIVTYDIGGTGANAKALKEISGSFRLCCGIFDFYPTADGLSFLVANLGAFQVDTYTNGKLKKGDSFGSRGDKFEQFHGCCNPVNVADIGGNFVVTVEKDPTRVKICTADGKRAKAIEGLGELVTGCTSIPVVVDKKGAIYLASAGRSRVVRCVTGTTPSPAAGGTTAATNSSPKDLTEVRDWTDQSGKKVSAKLVSHDPAPGDADGKPVVIRDGKVRMVVGQKVFNLPLARLSESDQELINKIEKDQDAE